MGRETRERSILLEMVDGSKSNGEGKRGSSRRLLAAAGNLHAPLELQSENAVLRIVGGSGETWVGPLLGCLQKSRFYATELMVVKTLGHPTEGLMRSDLAWASSEILSCALLNFHGVAILLSQVFLMMCFTCTVKTIIYCHLERGAGDKI